MVLDRYPINPEYGSGTYRRRVRLRKAAGTSLAMLDDNHHAMWVRLRHDGSKVIAVESDMIRIPADTCPGAQALLADLRGVSVTSTTDELFAGGRARRNCTHLFDMAVLALAFIQEPQDRRTIDIILPDDVSGRRRVQAFVDGQLIHDWTLEGEIVVAPAALAGRDLTRGFIGYAHATFDGIARDAASMIQKGVIVSRGRQRIVTANAGQSLHDATDMLGACYTYSEPRFSRARESGGYVRDFSNGVIETPEPA